MTKLQKNALLSRIATAGVTFTPNGFAGSRTQTLEGEIIMIDKREGYSRVYFLDDKGGEWTLGHNHESEVAIAEGPATVTIAAAKEKEKWFWIVG